MMPVLLAAVFAATPFYKPTPSPGNGDHVPHVMHGHHRVERHRHYYGGGYIDGYDQPDETADTADDDEPLARPAVIYRPERVATPVEDKMTFPTYTEIVVKGAPVGNGCTYKSVMSDDEIGACKRAARNELNQAK